MLSRPVLPTLHIWIRVVTVITLAAAVEIIDCDGITHSGTVAYAFQRLDPHHPREIARRILGGYVFEQVHEVQRKGVEVVEGIDCTKPAVFEIDVRGRMHPAPSILPHTRFLGAFLNCPQRGRCSFSFQRHGKALSTLRPPTSSFSRLASLATLEINPLFLHTLSIMMTVLLFLSFPH